jgi:acetyl esterase/lipase
VKASPANELRKLKGQNASTWRIDPNRIGAVGDSAGAHLALFLGSLNSQVPDLSGGEDLSGFCGAQSPKVSAVVDKFGPTDLTQPVIYTWVGPLALFGGRTYSQVPQLYQDASPIFVVSNKTAPTCIVQGLIDTTVPLSQANELIKQLSSSGIQVDPVLQWPRVLWSSIVAKNDHRFRGPAVR